ncbi:unnamed protein product [Chrysoparadoxa australica]
MAPIKLEVQGMMCQKNCGTTIHNALAQVAGVERVEVSFPRSEAKVWGSAALAALIEAVEDVGFDATAAPSFVLAIEGMMCQKNCGTTVEGVSKAEVSFEHKEAKVWCSDDVPEPVLIDAVETIGFEATRKSDEAAQSLQVGVLGSCHILTNLTTNLFLGIPHSPISPCVLILVHPSCLQLPATRSPSPLAAASHPDNEIELVKTVSFNLDLDLSLGVFAVHGMSCAACVRKVEKHISCLGGVHSVRVALLSEKAEVVQFDRHETNEGVIMKAVLDLGYDVVHLRTTLRGDESSGDRDTEHTISVEGMTCSACSSKVEAALQALRGVTSVSVSVATARAKVSVSRGGTGYRDLIECVQNLGYRAAAIKRNGDVSVIEASQERECLMWRRMLTFAAAWILPLMLLKMAGPLVGVDTTRGVACDGSVSAGALVGLLLVTPVQVIVGKHFYRAAWMSAKHGNFGMDMLVVVGTTSAYAYSLMAVVVACSMPAFKAHVFFETSGMLLLFISLGKWCESIAKGKTSQALTLLMKMQPSKVLTWPIVILLSHSCKSQYHTWQLVDEEIDSILVQPGDLLRVLPGSRVPTDGCVVSGSTYIDESMITGEPLPVFRGEGDMLYGGTVNQNGCVIAKAVSVGEDTLISQIVSLVEDAQMAKAPIQNYADYLAGRFTPVVLTISALTFICWYVLGKLAIIPEAWLDNGAGPPTDPFLFALLFSISVVVVACPCALGLATPTAVMVGTGVGARNGILIKGGAVLERAHEVTAVMFDKTGTLTTGKTVLVNQVESFGPSVTSGVPVLALAAACEANSEHPLGMLTMRSVSCTTAQSKPYQTPHRTSPPRMQPITDFSSSTGKGVMGQHRLGQVLVGNRRWVTENGLTISPSVDETMRSLEEEGKTAILVGLGKQVVGVLAVADQVKMEAVATVQALRQMGIAVWMATGDNARTAHCIARQVGISEEHVIAEALPQVKTQKVSAMQEDGYVVALVGDGVNDAPALATADVGIAIGAGSQVAIEAADIVLVRNCLHDVVTGLDLSARVFKRIRINFLWAMIYNVISIPFAAGLLYPLLRIRLPPAFAGLSMTASSVSVVLSSLSLLLYSKPKVDTVRPMSSKSEVMFPWLHAAKSWITERQQPYRAVVASSDHESEAPNSRELMLGSFSHDEEDEVLGSFL